METCGRVAVTIYLGLGSNLGDRLGNLKQALHLLAEHLAVCCISSVYETDPWGFGDQPTFLNCVCSVSSSLKLRELLTLVKSVEKRIGRVPFGVRWGPRIIDVDVLFFGDRVVEKPGLEIPHPRMCQRAFVLVPLAEIAPSVMHPVCKLTILEILERVEGKDDVRLHSPPLDY